VLGTWQNKVKRLGLCAEDRTATPCSGAPARRPSWRFWTVAVSPADSTFFLHF
jgi:hypothetical protein